MTAKEAMEMALEARCPNCASLEEQNTELDRKLAEMERRRRHVSYVCPQCHWSLEQPEQEPVAWCNCEPTLCDGVGRCRWQAMNYAHPPRREWRGLTEEDEIPWDGVDVKSFAKAIEAALKEKNYE